MDPLALREELGDTVCMVLCRPHPSSRTPSFLVFHGERAALEPAVGALREAGPAHLEALLLRCCCSASRPT